MAINSQFYNGRPACQHCGFCLFFMCEFRAEVDLDGDDAAAAPKRPAAARSGRAATSRASRPIANGRATGVAYFDAQKRLQLQRAKAVVLCANGAETPRLLLELARRRASRTGSPTPAAWSAST